MVVARCETVRVPERSVLGSDIARPTTRTSIGNKLKRFGPINEEPVRQAKGLTTLELLRAKLEMLRAMTPQQARDVIEIVPNLTLFEAVELAERTGRLIVPFDVIDGITIHTDAEFSARTGTLVIYTVPDIPFGKEVKFEGLRFSIPKQFQGKVNCALVIEHPDFTIKNKRLIIPDKTKIHLIEDFPKTSGWYLPDKRTKIPKGEDVEKSTEARHLWRIANPYLSLLVHGDGYGYYRQHVVAFYWASNMPGVALL